MAEHADTDALPELVLLPAGATFGGYVVEECIGQGAMGSVYRAEHALLKKPVALKLMDSALLNNSDARQRFLREGQAAAAIKHPNVVDITDVGVHESTPYLVMELLEGEDLETYLDERMQLGHHLEDHEVARLVLPIVAALAVAHDRGVLHRDLKPSNIFLARGPDGDVVPKVLDFGISKLTTSIMTRDFESTPFNQLMGSPLYLPPEAVNGARNLTAKSDQYSLGVILYECVTGRPPFAGDTLLSLLNAISKADFVPPRQLRPNISVGVERAILRAMHPDPAQRYEHVRDLGSALLDVAAMRTQVLWGRSFGRDDLSEPPRPRTSSPVALPDIPPEPPPSRRRGALISLVALAALVLPIFWLSRSGPPHLEGSSGASRLPSEVAARASDRTEAPAPAAVPEPSPAEPSRPREAVSQRVEPERWADRVPTRPEERPKNRRAKRATTAPPERSTRRLALLPETRPALLLPRETPGSERASEHGDDEVRELFFAPGTQPSTARGASSGVSAGVNESPILD